MGQRKELRSLENSGTMNHLPDQFVVLGITSSSVVQNSYAPGNQKTNQPRNTNEKTPSFIAIANQILVNQQWGANKHNTLH